jgi:hypothetical protein
MMRNHEAYGCPVVIRLFFDILLHRRGPQDVPAGQPVFLRALAGYVVVGAAVLWPAADGPSQLLAQVAVDLVLLVCLCGGLLIATGRAARIGQTLTALFGTGALLSAAALPFVWIVARSLGDPGTPPEALPPQALLSTLALFGLLLVSLLVTGHILRHALEWSYPAGVLAATGYFALSTLVFRSLFPVS